MLKKYAGLTVGLIDIEYSWDPWTSVAR
jgi:hypothetical protein